MIVYEEFLIKFSCSENVWNCSSEVVYFVNCGKWKSVQSVAMEQANLAYQSSTPCGTCCSLYSTHGCGRASLIAVAMAYNSVYDVIKGLLEPILTKRDNGYHIQVTITSLIGVITSKNLLYTS